MTVGADGGVAWVTLHREEDLALLAAMLAPWWEDLTNLGSRENENSRLAFIDERLGPRDVPGGYGTDLYDGPTWCALGAWLEDLEDAVTDPWAGLDAGATFDDYLTELDTRATTHCAMATTRAGVEWERELRRHLTSVSGSFGTTQVLAWVTQVRSLLVSVEAGKRETWT